MKKSTGIIIGAFLLFAIVPSVLNGKTEPRIGAFAVPELRWACDVITTDVVMENVSTLYYDFGQIASALTEQISLPANDGFSIVEQVDNFNVRYCEVNLSPPRGPPKV